MDRIYKDIVAYTPIMIILRMVGTLLSVSFRKYMFNDQFSRQIFSSAVLSILLPK